MSWPNPPKYNCSEAVVMAIGSACIIVGAWSIWGPHAAVFVSGVLLWLSAVAR